MSSTDAVPDAGGVFDRHVVPAGQVAAAHRAVVLPAIDPAADSYLVRRSRATREKAEFEWPAVATVDELRVRLTALWQDRPDLLALIEPLLTLGRVPAGGEGPAGDVPDHLYPMY